MSELVTILLGIEDREPMDAWHAHRCIWPLNQVSVQRPEPEKSPRWHLRRAIAAMQEQGWSVRGAEKRHHDVDEGSADVHIRGHIGCGGRWGQGWEPWLTVDVRGPVHLHAVQAILVEHCLAAVVRLDGSLVIYHRFLDSERELSFVELCVEAPELWMLDGCDPTEAWQEMADRGEIWW